MTGNCHVRFGRGRAETRRALRKVRRTPTSHMAAVLGVSVDTIQRRKRSSEEFCGAIKRGQATTRNSLRRLQLKKALEGNVTMLIWLGKQLLGQSDAQTLSHEGPQHGPIQYIEVERLPKRVRPDEAGVNATEASESRRTRSL